jgi:hypothetical protein
MKLESAGYSHEKGQTDFLSRGRRLTMRRGLEVAAVSSLACSQHEDASSVCTEE